MKRVQMWVMAEEAGSYDVFAGGVYGFLNCFDGVVHF